MKRYISWYLVIGHLALIAVTSSACQQGSNSAKAVIENADTVKAFDLTDRTDHDTVTEHELREDRPQSAIFTTGQVEMLERSLTVANAVVNR